MKPVVFVPEPIAPTGLELLRAECECVTPWEADRAAPAPDDALETADAVIVRLYRITAANLARAKRLKVIGKHGVGVDTIDCDAATSRGIPVVFTPAANANAVAEHTVALMLALARRIPEANAAVFEGRFDRRTSLGGVELSGRTLALVGLGRIGRRVAEIAALGLGMRVLAHDPFVTSCDGPAILVDRLDEMLGEADFVSLHVGLAASTRHLADTAFFDRLKSGCRLINTSRGAVVDEGALVAALAEGRLAGAALDVFEEEPLPADHPLCRAPNAVLTPHISSSTAESLDRMSLHVAQGVLDVLRGRRPADVANPQVYG